jgi:polysaccharide pyruvyl transferase WcaK-like protein
LFVRSALRLADYVSLRDDASRSLLRRIGFRGNAEIHPDCVYSLVLPCRDIARQATARMPTVGISPMAYCDPRRYWIRNQAAYDAFLAKLVDFTVWLRRHEYRPTLFSTDIWFDAQTLQAVDEGVRRETGNESTLRLADAPILSLDRLLSHMANMDAVITCRFHGVVFAHLMNIPVIALSHHPKVTTLMAELGLSEYCLDIDTFTPEQLRAAFLCLTRDQSEIRRRMASKAAEFKASLSGQFDALFSPEASR